MSLQEFASSVVKTFDAKIEPLVSVLAELRRFVDSNVNESDYVNLNYTCRTRFVGDVVNAIVQIHLQDAILNEEPGVVYYRVCQECDNAAEPTSRKIEKVKQYVCRNCGACLVIDDPRETMSESCALSAMNHINKVNTGDSSSVDESGCSSNFDDDDDEDDNSDDNDDDDDDDDLVVDKTRFVSDSTNTLLSISKWTLFKLATEVFLWTRCWFWGKCERPWYILWQKRNNINANDK